MYGDSDHAPHVRSTKGNKMADTKKYFWLKLKRDFFKRHDIQIIESMPNGKDYILFYLKLLCESVDHEGNLRFSEQIPYNEQMLSTITNTNPDIVKRAIEVFTGLNMMEILDDGTLYMNEINKMLGCETEWAKKKREYRDKKGQCPNDVPSMSDKSKSKRKSKNIYIATAKENQFTAGAKEKDYDFDKLEKELIKN
jgi:predicted phage replisome organizer